MYLHRQSIKQRGKQFLFIPAYDCNFRFSYCFEKSISNGGNTWSGEQLSNVLIKAGYDAIEFLEKNNDKSKKIVFYGGKPLLIKNLEIIESIVKIGLGRGYTFEAITNGYDLDGLDSTVDNL